MPAIIDAQISPDGQRIALLGGASDQRIVSIATIDKPGLPVLQLGSVEGVGLRWAGDGHVLARIAFWEKAGAESGYRFERNIVIDTQGKAVASLLDNDTLSRALVSQPVYGITSGPDPKAMVMGLIERGSMNNSWDTRLKRKNEDFVTTLWKVDPKTGDGVIVDRGGPDTLGWSVDDAGEPRIRREEDQLKHWVSILARPAGKGQWRQVWEGRTFASRRDYYGWSAATDSIYLRKEGRLIARRLTDGVETPVGTTASQPSLAFVWDPYTDALLGLSTGAERPTMEWLDPEIGAAHGLLSRTFKGKDVVLRSWSRDRTRFIARVSAPASPGVWYLYDNGRKEISPLGEEYPELAGASFGATRWMAWGFPLI